MTILHNINDINDCKGLEILAGRELCCLEIFEDSTGKRKYCSSYNKDEYKNKEFIIQSEIDLKDIICESSTEEGSSENSENNKNSEKSENERNSKSSSKLISLSQTIFILFFLIL